MVRDTILYDRLGVNENASEKDIKKSYHKLSMKWHPDKNDSKEAKTKFQELSEAYSILSDKEKRNTYDQVGIDMLKNGADGPNIDPSEIFKHFMGGMGGMGGFSPFGGMGGFSPFGSNSQNTSDDYEDCVSEVYVSIDQIYKEESININYKQKVYCKKCNGFGTKDGKESICSKCKGSGKVTIVRQMGNMIQQIVRSCEDCNGTGQRVSNNNKCAECNGMKFKTKNKNIDLQLNKNIQKNQKIILKEKGNIFKNIKTNLVIIVREKEHHIFTRNKNDLHMNMNIKLYQLLFGLNKSLKHMDNRKLFININPFELNNLDDKLIYVVNGEGMTKSGNLYIHFTIDNINMSKLEEKMKTILKNY